MGLKTRIAILCIRGAKKRFNPVVARRGLKKKTSPVTSGVKQTNLDTVPVIMGVIMGVMILSQFEVVNKQV